MLDKSVGHFTARLDLPTKVALIAALVYNGDAKQSVDEAVEIEKLATARVNEMKAATAAEKDRKNA